MMSAAKMFRVSSNNHFAQRILLFLSLTFFSQLEYAKNPPALLHIKRHCLDTELRFVEYSADNKIILGIF